jgi:hypothetical protein
MDNNTKYHFTEDNMKGKKVPKESIKNNLNDKAKNHENKKDKFKKKD